MAVFEVDRVSRRNQLEANYKCAKRYVKLSVYGNLAANDSLDRLSNQKKLVARQEECESPSFGLLKFNSVFQYCIRLKLYFLHRKGAAISLLH